MLKYLLKFVIIFFVLTSVSFAKKGGDEAFLQKEYGPDLTKAPFSLRYAFSKEFKRDWKNSDYAERHAYLSAYENSIAAQEAQDKADARAEAAKQKEQARAKKEAEQRERNKLRAELAEEKAQRQEDKDRQREFAEVQKTQRQELQQMKKIATEGIN